MSFVLRREYDGLMSERTGDPAHGPVDLTRIVDEVDAAWSEWDVAIHRNTGEVLIRMESDYGDDEAAAEIEALDEAGKLIWLHREPWDDNRRAERFIGRLGENETAYGIADAWSRRGRGRWARFKDALDKAGLLQDWFAYRLDAVRADVIRQLKAEDIAFFENPQSPLAGTDD